MQASDVSRARAAAIVTAAALDLPVDDAIVLHNSNKLALRLLPCDVFARVSHVGQEVAQRRAWKKGHQRAFANQGRKLEVFGVIGGDRVNQQGRVVSAKQSYGRKWVMGPEGGVSWRVFDACQNLPKERYAMTETITITPLRQPGSILDPLTEIALEGARQMLMAAVRAEAASFVARFGEKVLPDGRQRVVRHGAGPERTIQTGLGPLPVRRQKVRDRATDVPPEQRIRFTSNILPKWARRSRSLDALLPVLYLRGVSTGDFQEALTALLGADAPNLSPGVISRLTAGWQEATTAGAAAISRRAAMSTFGRTASICRPGWSRRPSACW